MITKCGILRHMDMKVTYDGEPIAPDPPYGAAVVVTRRTADGPRYLILHRAHQGPGHEGDWAWTPPSGCRKPAEDVTAAAVRELFEETGIQATPTPLHLDGDWAVYLLELLEDYPEPEVVLNDEHDRHAWVDFTEAIARCAPETVRDNLRLAQASLASRA
jgi:8-oxo-dGTP pyrophosphatase MutT (NUDIX family)